MAIVVLKDKIIPYYQFFNLYHINIETFEFCFSVRVTVVAEYSYRDNSFLSLFYLSEFNPLMLEQINFISKLGTRHKILRCLIHAQQPVVKQAYGSCDFQSLYKPRLEIAGPNPIGLNMNNPG